MNCKKKRLFDVIFSILFLIVFLPLMGLVAIVLRIFQGNPIIYYKKMIGLNGKSFAMLKFRTMVNNAEAEEKTVYERRLSREKLDNDSRITKIGTFLRKTSIDELPQLFNVLGGDMSLVGPRPIPEWIVDKLSKERKAIYLSFRPGITGIVQATNRNLGDFSQEFKHLEKHYYLNHSFVFDITILFKTIFTLFKGR